MLGASKEASFEVANVSAVEERCSVLGRTTIIASTTHCLPHAALHLGAAVRCQSLITQSLWLTSTNDKGKWVPKGAREHLKFLSAEKRIL